MKHTFMVAVRNDQGQILVLERRSPDGKGVVPCLPGGSYDEPSRNTVDATLVRILQARVSSDTGLTIGGIHLAKPFGVHCYTAFTIGGKLRTFPTEGHNGASWVTPSLALNLRALPQDMELLLKTLLWLKA